jgi:purine nucleosidase
MLLRAPEINLLGIAIVSGDQWVEPATVFALWATELTGWTDVPVVKGAENPLVNSKLELERREALYGSTLGWHGSFNPDAPKPSETWAPPGGFPKVKARPGRATDFILDTIHANPGGVVLYCAGPLTNVVLAVRTDPNIVPLAKAIYIMGGSLQGSSELNWTWDPEAGSIVLHEPWKEMVVSPFEAGEQVWSSAALMEQIVKAGGPLAAHVKQVHLDTQAPTGTSMWSMMWDELLVASLIDPTVIEKSETMYLDVDTDHGSKYGDTLIWKTPEHLPAFFLPYSAPGPVDREKWMRRLTPPAGLHPASVQTAVDVEKFMRFFVMSMSR